MKKSKGSRLQRGRIGGDVKDVVEGEAGDDWFHLLRGGAGAGSALHVVELADDVAGGTPGDGGHVFEALEIRTVAGGADNGFAVGAGGDEGVASFEAAGGDVGDEAGRVVAEFGAFEIFRSFDDAVADGFHFVGRGDDQHRPGNVGFGNELGFDDADPGLAFQSGEVVGGSLDFRVSGFGFEGDHQTDWFQVGIGTFADAAFEVGELLDDVGGREAGEAGIFRAALAVGEMAIGARVDFGLTAVGDDVRHGRVSGGMPVRDVEEVVDLRMGEGVFLAGKRNGWY